jgi:hypothetical protein
MKKIFDFCETNVGQAVWQSFCILTCVVVNTYQYTESQKITWSILATVIIIFWWGSILYMILNDELFADKIKKDWSYLGVISFFIMIAVVVSSLIGLGK